MTTPDLVEVYLPNGTPTSGGNGPGAVSVPEDEAARLVHEGLAIYGSIPPSGLYGNGVTVSPHRRTAPQWQAQP
jgi:hypothetical protein